MLTTSLLLKSYWIKVLRTSWVSPPRWRAVVATSQLHYGDTFRYHCSHSRSQHERTKWNYVPCLALSVPLIAAFARQGNGGEDDHDDANNKSSLGLFSTAVCATDISPERLAAIKSLNILSKVVEEVSPAVVSITAVGRACNLLAFPYRYSFPSHHQQYFFCTFTARHIFQAHGSTGSGFIVDDTGLVITNAHVVGYKQALKVSTSNGQEFPAKVLALDVNSDLALIQVKRSL